MLKAFLLAAVLAQPAASSVCDTLAAGSPQTYRNPRFGLSMTYPGSFVLDPGHLTGNDDSARFETLDRQVHAVITALPNTGRETLAELHREAEQDVIANSGGSITYRRRGETWFVITGYVAGRIYYRRTVLTRQSRIIGTLWIEFPPELRPCMDDIVTMMSRSFG